MSVGTSGITGSQINAPGTKLVICIQGVCGVALPCQNKASPSRNLMLHKVVKMVYKNRQSRFQFYLWILQTSIEKPDTITELLRACTIPCWQAGSVASCLSERAENKLFWPGNLVTVFHSSLIIFFGSDEAQ